MSTHQVGKEKIGSLFTDLAVLVLSFVLFSSFITNLAVQDLFAGVLTYTIIMMLSLNISRKIIFQSSVCQIAVLNFLLANFIGLIAGSIISIVIMGLILTSGNLFYVILLSATMAFFVLGTLSPLVKDDQINVIH